MGRPTKLTADRHDRILNAIRVGATLESAAEYADVTRDAIQRWKRDGSKAMDLAETRLKKLQATSTKIPAKTIAEPWLLLDESEQERERQALARFFFELQKATNEWEIRALARIVAASQKEWTAAAWLLERRKPELYGRKRIELTGAGGGPVEGRVVIGLPDNGR